MRVSSTTSTLFAAAAISGAVAQQQIGSYTTGKTGNATFITNNPAGVSYIAEFPATSFNKNAYPNGGNVKGSVQAMSMPNGHGVMFHVSFSNLPAIGGPFLYHIHDQPVPQDGNCTKTLAHLDPTVRGEQPVCNPALPETCQVGDLASKYGKVDLKNGSTTFTQTYIDGYATTIEGLGAFFGNRSIVFHFANATRITCANFAMIQASAAACAQVPNITATPTGPITTSRATTTSLPSNGTITGPPPFVTTLPPPFVTAAANANSAKALAAMGAAGLAFLL